MTTMLLSTSHLRCSSAVPNFGRQEFGLQEESVGGADTFALQARPCRLGNGKDAAGGCRGTVTLQKLSLNPTLRRHSRLTADVVLITFPNAALNIGILG